MTKRKIVLIIYQFFFASTFTFMLILIVLTCFHFLRGRTVTRQEVDQVLDPLTQDT